MKSQKSINQGSSSTLPQTLQIQKSSISITQEYASKYRKIVKVNKNIDVKQMNIKKDKEKQEKKSKIDDINEKIPSIFISLQKSTSERPSIIEEENKKCDHNKIENKKDITNKQQNNNQNLPNISQSIQNLLPSLFLRQKSMSLQPSYSRTQQKIQKPSSPSHLSTAFSILGRRLKSRFCFHPTQQQLREQIKQNFTTLNSLIQNTSKFFTDRMKTHEDELVKVMRLEIQNIQEQCKNTVKKLNQMIRKQLNGHQLRETREELQFYKIKLQQMSNQNLQLRKEIKQIKKINQEYQMRMEDDHEIMVKLKKKLMNSKKRAKVMVSQTIQEIFKAKNRQITEVLPEIKVNQDKIQSISISPYKYRSITELKSLDNNNNKQSPEKLNSKSTFLTVQKPHNFVKNLSNLNPETTCTQNHKNSLSSIQKLNKQLDRRYKLTPKVQYHYHSNQSLHTSLQISQFQSNKKMNYCSNRQKIIDYLKSPEKAQGISRNNQEDKRNLNKNNGKSKQINNKTDFSPMNDQEKWAKFKKNPMFVEIRKDKYMVKQEKKVSEIM